MTLEMKNWQSHDNIQCKSVDSFLFNQDRN